MSDFLTHLAARTLAAPSLRPRTPFRFEPAQSAPELPAFEDVPAAPVTRTRVDGAAPTATVSVPAPPTPPAPIAPIEIAIAERVESAPVTLPPAQPVPSTLERRPPGRLAGERPAPPPAGRQDAARPAGREAGVPPKQIVERETVTVVERTETQAADAAPAAPPHRYDEEPPRIVQGRETVERQTIHHVRETPPRTITRVATRRVASPAAAIAQGPSEPVIQVSIGRVEVRASTPPAATHRAPRRPMTIDEYAAKRKERR